MEYIEIESKHKEIIDIAKKYMMSIKDSEHDINHMNDVVNYTKELLDKIDGNIDKEVTLIAAYFHDVGRIKKDEGHEELSAIMLEEEMIKNNYDSKFISRCKEAIKNHKWNMTPTTIEGLIVRDADKLAWLGQERWKSCVASGQNLDSIISLLPKLRNDILYFEEAKKIYDRDIINLIKLLYSMLIKK